MSDLREQLRDHLFSRGEMAQYEMQKTYGTDNPMVRFVIGDIRDRDRLSWL